MIAGYSDPLNPVPELIEGIGRDVSSTPLLTIGDGGNGIIDGTVGDISHSPSGHLIDVDVGPPSDQSGVVFDLLSTGSAGPDHYAELNAIDVGPKGPTLANLDLLGQGAPGEGLDLLPHVLAAGGNGLVGDLLQLPSGGAADYCLVGTDIVTDMLPTL